MVPNRTDVMDMVSQNHLRTPRTRTLLVCEFIIQFGPTPSPHLPRLNRKLATKGCPCVCALSAPTICLSLVWYQVSPWPLGCVNNRWAGYSTPVCTKTREYDGIICYCGIKNDIILTKSPTLPFPPNKRSTCNQLIYYLL